MIKYIKPIIILVLLISCSNAEDSFFDKLPDLNKNSEIIDSSETTLSEEDKFDPSKIAELIDMAQDTKPIEITKDEEYESLDSTDTLADKLTLNENDAIRAQYLRCWSIPIEMPEDDSLVVKVKISLRRDGSLMKPAEVIDHQRMNDPSQKHFRVLAESALRAVIRCDPIKTPSIDKYEDWKTLQLNFDPREILR